MDLIYFTQDENIPALVISVDFEIAFDTLEWPFMYQCLEKFNFPPLIKQWVKILYTDIISCVTNNGWSFEYFSLERGGRQGCPLSPYMFILCAEVLAQEIRNYTKIEGIKIGRKEFKIKQYADDTQIFIQYSSNSLTELVNTSVEYSNICGLKINFDKIEVMRIGSIKHSSCIIETQPMLKWTKNQVKILGINLTAEPPEVVQANIYPALEKIQNIIKIGPMRKLTLFGKITVIKSLLESQLVYKLSVLPNPSHQQYAPMLEQSPNTHTFWLDVFHHWCCFNFVKRDDTIDPCNEILWYNSNIKVGHRLVFYKELYEKNIIYVKDLLNKNNKFMCYNELKEKYKTKTNYLLHMSLIQAIPTKYKDILAKNIKYETQTKNIEKIVQRKEKGAKLIYETKIDRNKHFPEKAYQ